MYPQFALRRLNLEFVRGFPSGPYLALEPDTASGELPPATESQSIIQLTRNIKDARTSRFVDVVVARDIDGIYIDGGKLNGLDLAEISSAIGLPVWKGTGGRYAAETGGMLILEEMGLTGMVADLGQTGLKISWAGRRWAFERDLNLLPTRHENGEKATIAQKGEQRRNLRKFIGKSIQTAVQEANNGQPEALVCALPCLLDRWGQPRGSSYIGMSNDTQLIPDALELAGWQSGEIILLNDAELAAVSALQDPRIQECSTVLVITLGYAIGTATLDLVLQAMVCQT